MSADRSPRAASSDTASARVGQRADSTVHLVETSKGRKLEDAGRECRAVTALAIGNIGKRRDAATGGHGGDGQATGGCCDARQKPRSHDTSRIAWAKLMARVGEEFPLACPACGGDIRLTAFITEPGLANVQGD